uniref:Uncharacterized protein n=1 Tax=Tanacetum cinerariifolium TaxID=118510 RepID=A0A6L2NI69_TANCI|nr:hypothetical protein [Tanacetum cinerariifolium]
MKIREKDYKGKYKSLKAELAILTKKIDVMFKNKSEKGLVAESFDWDEESLSSEDEGVTKIKAFMAIAKDEPAIGKADARFGVEPISTLKDVIPPAALVQTCTISNKTNLVTKMDPSVKVIKKKAQTKSPIVLEPSIDKKSDSSTKQLLLTLMKEVKGLKDQIKPLSDNSSSVLQTRSYKSIKDKQKIRFGPCKHYGFKNHLLEDCYNQP